MSLEDDLAYVEAVFKGSRWYGTHPDYMDIEGSSYDDALKRMAHFIKDLYLDEMDLGQIEDYNEPQDFEL